MFKYRTIPEQSSALDKKESWIRNPGTSKVLYAIIIAEQKLIDRGSTSRRTQEIRRLSTLSGIAHLLGKSSQTVKEQLVPLLKQNIVEPYGSTPPTKSERRRTLRVQYRVNWSKFADLILSRTLDKEFLRRMVIEDQERGRI